MRDPHSKVKNEMLDVEVPIDKVPAVSMDYTYLFEKGVQLSLVMVNHEHGRTWAYAFNNINLLRGEGWILRRIACGIDNAGRKDVNLTILSGREASIVAFQQEVHRAWTIPINSPVGESERDGRAENAIKRAPDKARTLKAQVVGETGLKIEKSRAMMSWLIRWSAELAKK